MSVAYSGLVDRVAYPSLAGKYRFWHCASVELCLSLGYKKRTVVTKQLSPKERGPAGFAFWFTFWHDACASMIARDHPMMLVWYLGAVVTLAHTLLSGKMMIMIWKCRNSTRSMQIIIRLVAFHR